MSHMTRQEAAEILFDASTERAGTDNPASFKNDRIAKMVAGDQAVIRACSLSASPKDENAEGDVAEAVSTLLAPVE